LSLIEIYLKEVLNDICVYLKRGPYKNMYQLKPEYRKGGGVPVASGSVHLTKHSTSRMAMEYEESETGKEAAAEDEEEEEFHQV
jgi:hypothetical protein